MNRQQRRSIARKNGPGGNCAIQFSARAAIQHGIDKLARDKTVQDEIDAATQRAIWLMICSIADAYGFGPKRMERFFAAFTENSEDLKRMISESGEDYSYEKIRLKAEHVTGAEIKHMYDKNWREALKQSRTSANATPINIVSVQAIRTAKKISRKQSGIWASSWSCRTQKTDVERVAGL